MAIDKEKLKDGLKTAFNTGVNFVKEATPYVLDGLTLAGQVANSLAGKTSSASSANNDTYKPSNQAQQYQANLNNLQKPVQQTSQWQQQLNDTMNAILNREKFSYDVNGDALFQQLKDQHILGGMLAQQEAVGQASAMTGGYGNSYAQTVGQQQFQGHMQQLTDKIPELYQLALDAHNQETADLYNRYGMLSDADAQAYARHRDQMSDYYTDRDYLTNQYYNERDFDYNKYVDDRNYQYQLDRDKVSDSQWQKTFDESIRQYNASLAEDKRQANLNYELSNKKISNSGGSNSGGSDTNGNNQNKGNGWNNGKLTSDQVKELQNHLGVTADGKWGKNSSAKADGMSADEAWAEYQKNAGGDDTAPTYLDMKGELAVLAEEGYTLKQLREYVNKLNNNGAIKNTLDYRRLYDYCYDLTSS